MNLPITTAMIDAGVAMLRQDRPPEAVVVGIFRAMLQASKMAQDSDLLRQFAIACGNHPYEDGAQ